MPDLGQGKDYKFVKDAEMDDGKFYKYKSTPTFTDALQVVTKAYVDSAPISHLPQDNCFFVGKAGSDAKGGRSEDDALLTIGAAITKANALTPVDTNQFNIYIIDGGVYTENITLSSYLHVIAHAARITGTVTLNDACSLLCNELYSAGTNAAIISNMIGSAGNAYVNILSKFKIFDGHGITGGTSPNNAGKIYLCAPQIDVDSYSVVATTFKGDVFIRMNRIVGTTASTVIFDILSSVLEVCGNGISNVNGIIFKGDSASVKCSVNALLSTNNKVYELTSPHNLHMVCSNYEEGIASTESGAGSVSLISPLGKNGKLTLQNDNGIEIIDDSEIATGKFAIYETHPTFSADTQLVDKKYVDDAVEVENLWDRSASQLQPHNSGDTVRADGGLTVGTGAAADYSITFDSLAGAGLLSWVDSLKAFKFSNNGEYFQIDLNATTTDITTANQTTVYKGAPSPSITTFRVRGSGASNARFEAMRGDDSAAFVRWQQLTTSVQISYGTSNTQHIVNASSQDVDYKIRGQTDSSLFVTDAANDRVGIGTATPAVKFDVDGRIKAALTNSLQENVIESTYTVNADASDGICYQGTVGSSVATTSGEKIAYRAAFSPNAGDTSGTGYIAFQANAVGATNASIVALEVDTGYDYALLAATGAIVESVSSTQSVVAATGITDIIWVNILVESSTAGNTTVTANPAISAGQAGQRITVIGTDATKTVTLTDGNGLDLTGGTNVVLALNDTICFKYIGTTWIETSRSIK